MGRRKSGSSVMLKGACQLPRDLGGGCLVHLPLRTRLAMVLGSLAIVGACWAGPGGCSGFLTILCSLLGLNGHGGLRPSSASARLQAGDTGILAKEL